MQVYWSDEALETLERIRVRMAHFTSEARANEWAKDMMRRVDRLQVFPFSAPAVEGFESAQVRELILDDYHVLYWVSLDQVEILGVYHGRQAPLRP